MLLLLLHRYDPRRSLCRSTAAACTAVARSAPSHFARAAVSFVPLVPVATRARSLRASHSSHSDFCTHHSSTSLGTHHVNSLLKHFYLVQSFYLDIDFDFCTIDKWCTTQKPTYASWKCFFCVAIGEKWCQNSLQLQRYHLALICGLFRPSNHPLLTWPCREPHQRLRRLRLVRHRWLVRLSWSCVHSMKPIGTGVTLPASRSTIWWRTRPMERFWYEMPRPRRASTRWRFAKAVPTSSSRFAKVARVATVSRSPIVSPLSQN